LAKVVKGRQYTSTLRQEQAAATRGRIVRAAAQLFADHGYSQTTIDQIAERAGVARPTVYTAFPGKPALLKQAVDVLLAGDDAPIRVRDRPWVEEALRQRDPRAMLELQARNDRMINERIAPLYEAVRNASATDDNIADLYATLKHERLAGARITVDALAALGPLRDGLDLAAATDILWVLKDPALWTALVTDRAWPAERYQAWLAGAMQDSLLPAPAKRRSPAR
jgi:TetR/AcrR family transcriptional regulator, regulator of autoinduction and epiphytic fitness